MTDPLLSLIVPYHNSEKQDRSVLMDAMMASIPDTQEIEIILVNDHSTSVYSPKIQHQNSKIIHIDAPAGQRYAGPARNLGLQHATGRWISFVDSDDYFTDNVHKILETLKHAKVDQILTLYCSITSEGAIGTRHEYVNSVVKEFYATKDPKKLTKHYCSPGRFIVREHLQKHNIGFENRKHFEDNCFTTKLAVSSPTTEVIFEQVYAIRESDESLSSSLSNWAINDKIEAILESNKILKKAGWTKQIYSPYSAARGIFSENPQHVTSKMLQLFITGKLPIWPKRFVAFFVKPFVKPFLDKKAKLK